MLLPIRLVCSISLLMVASAFAPSFAGEPSSKLIDKAAVPATGKVTVTEVKAMIDRKEPVFIFDANTKQTYIAGHVPGARWVQFNAVNAKVLPGSKSAKLVFYCYNPMCSASPMAAKTAIDLGYKNVWLMPDGITGWRKSGMPVVSGD